jgi:hypothetical protein
LPCARWFVELSRERQGYMKRMMDCDERGSIPEWVMLLVMGVGVVMALWAIVQPDITQLVSDAFARLRG